MPDIMHLVKLKASPAAVYEALTTSEGVRAWWTSDADLEEKVGGFGVFRFYGGGKVTRVRIDELDVPNRVRWTVVDSFRREWIGTTISFDLKPADDGAQLLFAQRGFPEADENYAICTTGWGIYFDRLQQDMSTASKAVSGEVGGIVGAFKAQLGDPTSEFAMVARFRVAEGAQQRVERAFARAVVPTQREAGVLAYQPHRDPAEPTSFVVYERWKSLDALEAHLRTPYIAELRREIAAAIAGTPDFNLLRPL